MSRAGSTEARSNTRSWDALRVCDDQVRESLDGAQLELQRVRGIDLTIFSPRASSMAHHAGQARTSRVWSEICNELGRRCTLYPHNFIEVCQLPPSPGVSPATCISEPDRCVKEFGFVGANLNADPSAGYWNEPPLTDKRCYPLYKKMVELEGPAMVHGSLQQAGRGRSLLNHQGPQGSDYYKLEAVEKVASCPTPAGAHIGGKPLAH